MLVKNGESEKLSTIFLLIMINLIIEHSCNITNVRLIPADFQLFII